MVSFNHRPARTNCQRPLAAKIPRFFGNGGFPINVFVSIRHGWAAAFGGRNAGDGVPYGPNSIRRAETSDQSRGPNGVIQPPACQNELSAATGRKNPPFPEKRGISHQMCSSQYARAGLPPSAAGTPGTAFPTVRIPYAERKLATGREVLLDCRQANSIRHEFESPVSGETGDFLRRAAAGKLVPEGFYLTAVE